MVEVQHLTKHYGDTVAIEDVTFEARDGEILGFLGKNGAGKTTTMRIMTGFMQPTSGTVRVNGYDIRESPLEAKAQIGYLPETAPLYEDMSVQGYLAYCARLRKVPAGEIPERLEQVMRSVNILDRRDWIISKLSKGLRRRVGMAQALVHHPRVLIMDEPTEGLDPAQIIEIRNLIRGLRGDHTVILSTHILPEAQALADRIIIIDQGRIVAVDTTANLTAAVQSTQRILLDVSGPPGEVRARLEALPGVRAVEPTGEDGRLVVESDRETDLRDLLAREIVGAGWALREMERLEPSLEDVFLHLTRVLRAEPAPSEEAESSEPATRSDRSDGADRSVSSGEPDESEETERETEEERVP